MTHRVFANTARMIALLLFSVPAYSDDARAAEAREADWAQRLTQAAELQATASARQAEADKLLAQKHAECLKTFLVTSCQKDASAEHLVVTKETRLLSNQGKAIERQIKKEQLSAKDAQRAEEASDKVAERERRAAETTAERQAVAAEEAATRADKAKKAEAGAQRKAAEAERARQKHEAHAAKIAEKKAAAERRAATAGKE